MKLSTAIEKGREWVPGILPSGGYYLGAAERMLVADTLCSALIAETRTLPPRFVFSSPEAITAALADRWPDLWKRVKLFPGLGKILQNKWGLNFTKTSNMSLFSVITLLDSQHAREPGYARNLSYVLKACGI